MAELSKKKHGVVRSTTRFCSCGQAVLYSTFENDVLLRGYDAFFCLRCDEWFESGCSDLRCEYCARRPLKPSHVPYEMLELVPKPPKPDDVLVEEDAERATESEPLSEDEKNNLARLFSFFTCHKN